MIGVLSPYGRNEVTAAAIRVADLAVSLGIDVRLIACGPREQNVHPYWDSRVLSGRGTRLYHAAKGCGQFIHFDADRRLFDATKLVAERAGQVLVLCWHDGRAYTLGALGRYDTVVCPTKQLHDVLRHEPGPAVTGRLTWCRWDAGLAPVRRHGTVSDGVVRAAFQCDSAAIDYCGPLVIQLAAELLSLVPDLSITMLSSKSWGRKDRQAIKKATARWPGRLEARGAGNLAERVTALHAHDWAVTPSVLADFGMGCARALACGVPCVAHDVGPFNEFVVDRHNGHLVPCEVRAGANGAPIAVPNYATWVDVCHRAFRSASPLLALQRKDWCAPGAAFDEFWGRLLIA